MYAKLAVTAFLAFAPLAGAAAQQGDRASGTAEAVPTTTERAQPARQERLICRRIGLTGQPTSMRRVCLTSDQWRQVDDGE
ncbi:MAG TPA: hypothetical protein VF702_07025 [Allosphingosinicella sp.]|jgi:hypothetical protein